MNQRKHPEAPAAAASATPASQPIAPPADDQPAPESPPPLARGTMEKLLRLAALRLGATETRALEDDLGRIIALIDALGGVETSGVAPLAHPLEMEQPLRADVVTEDVNREHMQRGAPAVRDGLYLVPRVVE